MEERVVARAERKLYLHAMVNQADEGRKEGRKERKKEVDARWKEGWSIIVFSFSFSGDS